MTDTLVERVAKSDAEFDGRTWLGMPAAERKRYLARAERSTSLIVTECAFRAEHAVLYDDTTIDLEAHVFGSVMNMLAEKA